ncbi:MAG: hypothetical protein AAF202_08775 [Pseudomonadota bacterium]
MSLNFPICFFCAVVLLLSPVMSWAQQIDMAAETIEFVAGMRAKGIETVGSLDLGTFQAELGTIDWSITSEAFERPAVDKPGLKFGFSPSGGLILEEFAFPIEEEERPYRESARYELGVVTVHESVLGLEPVARQQVLLHEAFGALGYNDHQFALSGSLMLINRYPQTLEALGKALFNEKSLRAGGSSVGGGGDSIAMEVKARTLRSIMRETVSVDFLVNFVGIAFEPMDEPENQRVMINYKVNLRKSRPTQNDFLGVRQDRRYEELVTVFFPRAAWKQSPEKRGEIIAFIHYGITSFFQTSAETAMAPIYGYRRCNGEPLLAPLDRATGADLVLRFRDVMLSSCHHHRPSRGFGCRMRPAMR